MGSERAATDLHYNKVRVLCIVAAAEVLIRCETCIQAQQCLVQRCWASLVAVLGRGRENTLQGGTMPFMRL